MNFQNPTGGRHFQGVDPEVCQASLSALTPIISEEVETPAPIVAVNAESAQVLTAPPQRGTKRRRQRGPETIRSSRRYQFACGSETVVYSSIEMNCLCRLSYVIPEDCIEEIFSDQEICHMVGREVLDYGMCLECQCDVDRYRRVEQLVWCQLSWGHVECETCSGPNGTLMGKCFVSPGEGNAERKRKHKEARNKTVHANPVQHKKKGGHKKNNGDEAVVTNPVDQKAGGAPMPPDDAPDAEAEVHYNPWSPSDILARCPPDKIPKALKLYAEHYEQHVFNLVEYHPVVSAWATKVKNTIALNHHRGVNCPRPEFERVGGYNVPAMFKAGKSLPATPSGAYNIYLIEGVVGADGCFIGYDHDVEWKRSAAVAKAVDHFRGTMRASYFINRSRLTGPGIIWIGAPGGLCATLSNEAITEYLYGRTLETRRIAARKIARWIKSKTGAYWVDEEIPDRQDEPYVWVKYFLCILVVWAVMMALLVEGVISFWQALIADFMGYLIAVLACAITFYWWNGTTVHKPISTLGMSSKVDYENYNNFDAVDIKLRRLDMFSGYKFNRTVRVRYPRWMLTTVEKRLISYNAGLTIPGNVRTVLSDDSNWPKLDDKHYTMRWHGYIYACAKHYAHLKNLEELKIKRAAMDVTPTYQILNFQQRAGRAGYGNPGSTTPNQLRL